VHRERLAFEPDFLVLGVEKSGNSSLYEMIARHPMVVEPRIKEVHRHFHYAREK
jgi:hypothetical protein